MLVYMPFITSVWTLHGAFLAIGFSTSVIDTGCQIMTQKIHGTKAGPWIGANTVALSITGVAPPSVGYLTADYSLFAQYVVVAATGCLAASTFFALLPAQESFDRGLIDEV